ncbi:MAG: cyanophycinase [Alphaproteobacteria bacterium]|nr:cyanophycinase [Alphaproteobacteria bacterium]
MRLFVKAAVLAAALTGAAHAEPGRLVIAGGAVSRDNVGVHGAFLEHVGANGRIAVIPAASGEPAQSAAAYIETLRGFGVNADRIDIVRLAVIDDDATPDVDESAWAANATNPDEIAKISAASGVWFTGGDQMRITATLLTAGGAATPMLSAIRGRLAAGATIGGTSAGAAIMSQTMIARGDSLAALTRPLLTGEASESEMDGGALMVAQGLGFFHYGLVDQHFDRKARLGRLTRALAELAPAQRLGFGVDEDTALVVDLAQNTAFVAGASGVTVLDAREAQATVSRRGRFAVTGVALGHLATGDRIDLATLAITPAAGRAAIPRGEGYYNHAAQSGAGMALPNDGLEDALGVELLDNRVSDRLERVSFDGEGVGVLYVFEETSESFSAYGDDATGAGRYTIGGARFSIEPVDVRIRRSRP